MRITLANLEQATAQQVAEQAAHHLLTQGKKSLDPTTGLCMYHSSGGLACAAGCFISDEEYQQLGPIENVAWESVVTSETHCHLISTLQVIHDSVPPERWLARLRELFARYDFDPACLEEFAQ